MVKYLRQTRRGGADEACSHDREAACSRQRGGAPRAVVATRMIGAPLGNLAMDRFIGQSTAEAFIDKFGRAIGADVTQSRHTARVMAATAAEEA